MFSIKLMTKILIVFLFFSSSFCNAQSSQKYVNVSYGYSIEYPSFLLPQGESQNQDGQVFLSKDKSVKLSVWGSHNALNLSIKDYFNLYCGEKKISYSPAPA